MPTHEPQTGRDGRSVECPHSSRYQQASDALDVESRRLGLDEWRFPAGTCPMVDETYVRALNDLVAADDERIDASNAAQRESCCCWRSLRIGPA